MKRDVQGKFALKNDDYRSVRSFRLTDRRRSVSGSARLGRHLVLRLNRWALPRRTCSLDLVRNRDHSFPRNTRLLEDVPPSNTREEVNFLPSNTWQEKELEQLKAEIQHLHQENALLVERLAVRSLHRADLEAWRVQSLKKLNLGRQAPGSKAAQKALEHFIVALTGSDKTSFF